MLALPLVIQDKSRMR